ncbi:MAG: hypothetical protein FD120_963 [Gammaproteobacteria bacterium]|nr:MAG: hypothetical protein FD120_963 [Gammaproteobacteria bacterium]
MTGKNYSLDALNKFFDFAAEKGLLKRNTALSRKLAANKILAVLDESEKADLRNADISKAFERFQNLQGTDYKPDSLQVYLSRLRTALSDFTSYVDNPAAYKPTGAQRASPKGKREADNKIAVKNEGGRAEQGTPDSHDSQHIVVPVPLREGLTVKISNLPSDLTAAEAGRLAAIIKAYAVIGGD